MSPRIEGVVARLHGLHPRLIDLSLDRLLELLARLGHPERRLPPVIHVAGTNGKGSTCAFLRGIAEAAGQRVHVYTSPHLVRFNERIRLAGQLVDDDRLAEALEHVEQVNAGAPITVFEVITAVALYLFAETPADLCVLEVGLGGRGDATNVIPPPAATAITSISLDHRELLGDTLAVIAAEKGGILKPDVPVAIGSQTPEVTEVLLRLAAEVGAPVWLRGRDWDIAPVATGLRYQDNAGSLDLPPPSLAGAHQHDNAGIAIAALRAGRVALPPDAFAAGLAAAEWPARLQRLHGPLARRLPPNWELWLDGGHNPGAGLILADQLRTWADKPVHLVVGMKQAKDSAEFLRPLIPLAASLWAVAEPDQHAALPLEAIIAASGGVARRGPHVADALDAICCEAQIRAGQARKVNQASQKSPAGQADPPRQEDQAAQADRPGRANRAIGANRASQGDRASEANLGGLASQTSEPNFVGTLAADPGKSVGVAAIRAVEPARVLICGSLYLAGEVLKQDG